MTAFILALQFLTRIPVFADVSISDKQLGQSVLFYPVIGFMIGCILLFAAFALGETPATVQAAIILTLWVLITGGLHLDGLADCADGWAGGLGNPERSLKIMKDPTSGAIAVVTLVLVLLLKWTALAALVEKQMLFPALIIIPFLGRAAILALMLGFPYVSRNGLGECLNAHFPVRAASVILSLCLLAGVYALGIWSILFAALVLVLTGWLAKQRLGGVTGDVYGAGVELTETALLVSLSLQ